MTPLSQKLEASMPVPMNRDNVAKTESSVGAMNSADAFEQYRRRCGGTPVLTQPELRVEVQTAGLRYEDLDEPFWTTLLRRPDHRHLE